MVCLSDSHSKINLYMPILCKCLGSKFFLLVVIFHFILRENEIRRNFDVVAKMMSPLKWATSVNAEWITSWKLGWWKDVKDKTLKGKLGLWRRMWWVTNRCSIHVCFPSPYFIILMDVRIAQDQHLLYTRTRKRSWLWVKKEQLWKMNIA